MATATWLACYAAASLSGEMVSSPTFNTSAHCIPATVPGTIFTTLLNNNAFNFTDPFLDSNLYWAPDINTTGREYYTYFYRTEIETRAMDNALSGAGGGSASMDAGGAGGAGGANDQIVWLRLRGINYRAQVYIDGQLVKEDSTQSTVVEGMYRRWNYVVPPSLPTSTTSTIAVLVEPPDFPGSCRVACPHCGQGGSHELAKSTTMQFSAGWDWIQGTPDRNTGLWDLVIIESSNIVSFRHSFVETSNIVLSTTPGSPIAVSSTLTPSTTLIVRGGEGNGRRTQGTLTCQVAASNNPSIVVGTSSVAVNKIHDTDDVDLEILLPLIELKKPTLWWPHTHGNPFLYRATFTFTPTTTNNAATSVANAATSNAATSNATTSVTHVQFGVRLVDTYIDTTTKGRAFKINGVPVFLTGGNWIHTDQFLRYASNSKRYFNEVNMHVQMGMNIIRVWGGGLTERPEFYNAADRLGMLIMQEFWMTGRPN